MRLVVFRGIQYDADKLPPHVDARQAVPLERWFAENRSPRRVVVESVSVERPKKRRTRRTSKTD